MLSRTRNQTGSGLRASILICNLGGDYLKYEGFDRINKIDRFFLAGTWSQKNGTVFYETVFKKSCQSC